MREFIHPYVAFMRDMCRLDIENAPHRVIRYAAKGVGGATVMSPLRTVTALVSVFGFFKWQNLLTLCNLLRLKECNKTLWRIDQID